MNKTINKTLTALVAIATISSIVPTYAFASSKDAKDSIESQDGSFTEAIAFTSGKYLYDGYIDEHDTSLYYGKNNIEDETEDTTITSKFGPSYVEIGSDEKVLDMKTGKLLDDSVSDMTSSAKTKIKSSLRKTDRYSVSEDSDISAVTPQLKGRFGELWYSYTAKADKTEDASYLGIYNKSKGVVDLNKYANMIVYNSTTKKVGKIKEFNSKDSTTGITLKLNSVQLIAQDKSYLYFYSEVTASKEDKSTETLKYIQKVSKATKKDNGVTYPSSTYSYLISKSLFSADDVDKIEDIVTKDVTFTIGEDDKLYAIKAEKENKETNVYTLELDKGKYEVSNETSLGKQDAYIVKCKETTDIDATKYSIDKDGTIWFIDDGYVCQIEDSDVDKKFKIDNSMESIDVYDSGNIMAWSDDDEVSIKSGSAVNDDDDDDKDNDKEDEEDTETAGTVVKDDGTKIATSLMADGSKIIVKTGTDGKTLKTVIGAKDKDTGNTTTTTTDSNGKITEIVTDSTGKIVSTKVKEEMKKEGHWDLSAGEDKAVFIKADGNKAVNEWIKQGANWGHVDINGKPQTGWFRDSDNKWYYLGISGVMLNGWQQVNGTWYYMNASGAMQTGWVELGAYWYFLNESGAMKTGWVKVSDTWYYMNQSGQMLANTTVDGYTLGENGALKY